MVPSGDVATKLCRSRNSSRQDQQWFVRVWSDASGKRQDFSVTKEDLEIVGNIARLFGHLSVPIGAALLTILPRIDVTTHKGMDALLHALGNPIVPLELVLERWLMESGMINTAGRPDAERYIQLLRSLVVYTTEVDNITQTTKPQFNASIVIYVVVKSTIVGDNNLELSNHWRWDASNPLLNKNNIFRNPIIVVYMMLPPLHYPCSRYWIDVLSCALFAPRLITLWRYIEAQEN